MITRSITSRCTAIGNFLADKLTSKRADKPICNGAYCLSACLLVNLYLNKMDALSEELQDFLIRLGKEPQCVSEKVEHYIKHIMHLVYADDEDMLQQYYGLFGNDVMPLEDIARERHVSNETMLKIIEANLRKMAVSPEWQMVKQLIDR